jgi:hypothetical protein
MPDEIKPALSFLLRALSRWLGSSFLRSIFDDYRPERHYMRGSGLKSRSASAQHAADFHADESRHELGVTNGR